MTTVMLKIEKMFDHGTLELKPEKEIINGSEHTLRRVTVKFVLQFRHSSTSSSSCQRTSVSAARIFSSSTLKNFICFNFSKFLQAYQFFKLINLLATIEIAGRSLSASLHYRPNLVAIHILYSLFLHADVQVFPERDFSQS